MTQPEVLAADTQLELLRAATRGRRVRPAEPLAAELPVSAVAVDVPLPHLDRPFDYAVPESMSAAAQPGVRVRVRFAGQDVDGFVLSRGSQSEHPGRLLPLRRVVSAEPVLAPEVLRLARTVADRYAGTLSDVLRLAVPPRHARVEGEAARGAGGSAVTSPDASAAAATSAAGPAGLTAIPDVDPGSWARYPAGPALIGRLAAGQAPRAVWTSLPGPHWPAEIAIAVAAAVAGGRGALVVLPDQRDVAALDAALTARLGPGRHVRLTADLGPAARYRSFLALRRGAVRVAVGTRAAAFAPVRDLGLALIWDDGDDLHDEPRAPYPHAREVLALRSELESAALIAGGWSATADTAAWLRSGWARPVTAQRTEVRARWPRVTVAESAVGADADPASAARVPAAAFGALQAGLHRGPVLVQVPRAGYLPGLACRNCRRTARCPHCHGPVQLPAGGPSEPAGRPAGNPTAPAAAGHTPSCGWCGRELPTWSCPYCGDRRLRARSVGAVRTAEELGRAFPGVPVVLPRAGEPPPAVPSRALVVATPGLECAAPDGYAAGVLLDGGILLGRPDLRAAEDALRRWLAAAALVRPPDRDGELVICGPQAAPAVQALVRLDPLGFADRELAERTELGFPPASAMASISGAAPAVTAVLDLVRTALDRTPEGAPAGFEALGPIPLLADDGVRLVLRCARAGAGRLAVALREAAAIRSAGREQPVRIKIDPRDLG